MTGLTKHLQLGYILYKKTLTERREVIVVFKTSGWLNVIYFHVCPFVKLFANGTHIQHTLPAAHSVSSGRSLQG